MDELGFLIVKSLWTRMKFLLPKSSGNKYTMRRVGPAGLIKGCAGPALLYIGWAGPLLLIRLESCTNTICSTWFNHLYYLE